MAVRALWLTAAALLLAACAGDASPAATITEPSEVAVSTSTTDAAAISTTSTTTPAASAGCGASAPIDAGESVVPFTAAGLDGTVIRHIPSAYDGVTPLPVVFGLHGWSQPAAILGVQSRLPAAAERDGFILLLPDITRPVPLWDTALDGLDTSWFAALFDEIETSLCVDTERLFVTGMSNGAMMTSTLVCRLADRIAAAAPVAGIRLPDGCAPSRPVPIISFHGTDDQYLAYDGGFGAKVAGLSTPDGTGTLGDVLASGPDAVPVPDRVAAWSALNGCSDALTGRRISDDVVVLSDERCDTAVLLYSVEGGGHTWPGSEFDTSIAAIVGATTLSIDATDLMLDFFASSTS